MIIEDQFKQRLLEVSSDRAEQMITDWKLEDKSARNLRRYWREARGIEGSLEEMERKLVPA